jgi:transcriptional antiterminator NusG
MTEFTTDQLTPEPDDGDIDVQLDHDVLDADPIDGTTPDVGAPSDDGAGADEATAEDVLSEDELLADEEGDEDEEGAAVRVESPYDRPGQWFVVHTYAGYENKV